MKKDMHVRPGIRQFNQLSEILKKALLLSFFLVYLINDTVSKNYRLDSLNRVWLDETKSDTARLRALTVFAYQRWLKCDHDSLEHLGRQVYDYASSIDNKKYQKRGLTTMGYACLYNRHYDKAENYLKELIKVDSALGYRWSMARTYGVLAEICMRKYEYAEAHVLLDSSYFIFHKLQDTSKIAYNFFYRGQVALAQGKYPLAISWFEKAIGLAERVDHKWGITWYKTNIATIYLAQGKYDMSIALMEDVHDFHKDAKEGSELAQYHHALGRIYSKLGQYEVAHEYYRKSIETFKKKHMDDAVGNILSAIGDDYVEMGKYNDALEIYNKALRLYQKKEVKHSIGYTYLQIGKLNAKIENYDQCLFYYRKSLKIFKEVKKKALLAEAYNELGEVYGIRSQYDSASHYYQKSLKINKEIDHEQAISTNGKNFGDLYKKQGDYQKAAEFYHQALAIRERNGDKIGSAEIYTAIGRLNIDRKNYREGLVWSQKGFGYAEEYNLLRPMQRAAHELYRANKGLGKGQAALTYYELSTTLKDSLKIDEVNRKVLMMEYERQRSEDSLVKVEANLKRELAFQEKITKEKNTRNTYMFAGFGVLFLAGVVFSRMLYIRRANRELERKNAQIALEKERTIESEKAKERFFDNVSHEFRTPLTLILGPAEEALKKTSDTRLMHGLHIMKRNALRMRDMINELLDLSKLEFGKVQLQVSKEEIVGLTTEFLQSFESMADQKDILLRFKSGDQNLPVWIDAEKYRKVLANLLSNAIKFTGEGGEVTVEIDNADKQHAGHDGPAVEGIWIKVRDTGTGIPAEKLPHIFDRFYQVNQPDQIHHGGTGIGLALTRELVELHQGKISVESKPGAGTCFTIFLLSGKAHFEKAHFADEYTEANVWQHDIAQTEPETWAIEKEISGHVSEYEVRKKNGLLNLLIVEDNQDMRSYIKAQFEGKYNTHEASDGGEGLHFAIENIPDLIISDVMMPVMDGHTMTEKLKTDIRTSHIPVIILTARASTENKIEGLETGADAYLTKPFDARELQVRVDKLIEQRDRLRVYFSELLENNSNDTFDDTHLSAQEKEFLQKAMEVINNHLADHDFHVDLFASEMTVSRVQLHRKIKALTGKTPGEQIRTIRLNKAAQMLKNHTGNVSQVADEVGFNSLSWFARVFKDQFGVSPSKFRENTSAS
jgi:signal transduction histidine kinase/DNA-binding response OmpR family regulator/Tfp pilus assembly protein PilF